MSIHKMSYFPEPCIHSKNKIRFELDLSNYARKSDLESATGVDTPKFAKKIDLASLKAVAGKLDIEKLKTVPADLSKHSE